MIKLIAAIFVFLAICIESFFSPLFQTVGEQAVTVRLSSDEVANGNTLLLEVTPADSVQVRHITIAREDTVELNLFPHPLEQDDAQFAFIGIPYFARPDSDIVHVTWTEDDKTFAKRLPFKIVRGKYRSSKISGVPQNRVTPSAADYRRIARERKQIAAAYISVRDSLMMEGPFRMPTEKVTITSEYGTRRVFNGQLRSYHSGLDLRAYMGTPLYAAQSGRVKLAKNLFFSGNHVLIEHGMGIYSSYSHMSKLHVETGQWVEKGQLLGLSGATGRVTAAHLHWTVNVNGVRVSPLQFYEVMSRLYGEKGEGAHDS